MAGDRSVSQRRLDWGALALDAVLGGGALAVLALSAFFKPENLPLVPACLFRSMTGLSCPGCGLTRAFCAISHGDFAGAWHFNPFSFLFYAATLALLAWPFVRRARPEIERRLVTSRLLYLAPLFVALAMWLFGLVRIIREIAAR